MRREDFHNQLTAASFDALRFGQEYVSNRLSLKLTYVAVLNQSYDENRKEDEVVYPEDDGKIVPCATEREVVDLLYRKCRCPQWIDISVAGADKTATLLRLLCCGRYHHDETRLYYYQRGTQPFGIKSPDLPPGWKDGNKFKLHKRDKALNLIINNRGYIPRHFGRSRRLLKRIKAFLNSIQTFPNGKR